MKQKAIESLKRDFSEWSGGFEPESSEQITVYIDYACPARADLGEVRLVLMDWMNGSPSADQGGGMTSNE